MKRIEAVIASTDVDSQGERMDREGLEGIVEAISHSYIPVGIEHDPRVPPQGRIASASIRERSDGEYEVVAMMEFFDGENEPPHEIDARELRVKGYDLDGLSVSYDWTHRFDQDQSDIADIAEVFKNKAVREVKKSADPLSILQIAGGFALGAIASGFFGQIGADGWNVVKKKLADVFSRKENRQGEQLLIFRVVTNVDGHDIEIEFIITNPTPDDIDRAFDSDLQMVDELASEIIHRLPDVRRIVFEVEGEILISKFAVLKDCTPLKISLETEAIKIKD